MIILFSEYDVDETGMSIPRGGIKKDAIDVRAFSSFFNIISFLLSISKLSLFEAE